MPLNTVQVHIKTLLDGLDVPGTAGALEAFITPPGQEECTRPKAYIWPSGGDEKRQSTPRIDVAPSTAAWKQVDHLVDVWLTWFSDEDADAADIDLAFPAVVDMAMDRLRASPEPAEVTDPFTSRVSYLCGVGERMSFEFYPVVGVPDERINRYDCRLQLPITELFQS